MRHRVDGGWSVGGRILAILVAGAVPGAAALETHVFRHENVMGTSLELRVEAGSADAARRAESAVLGEVDRLSRIFSTYTPDSEFSRWQATRGRPVPVSEELFQVMSLAEGWREASGGAFAPGAESVNRAWRAAAARGSLPTESDLDRARREAQARPWDLKPADRTATRLTDGPLTLNAIAKGWIVERAGNAALRQDAGLRGLLLNVGGDLRHWGAKETVVAIADPRADGEGAPAFTSVHLRNAALATSGNYRRHFRIGDRTYSHIVDPRSGQPADAVLSASVIAPDSATADALATTLSVVEPGELRGMSERWPGVEWMLVKAGGEVVRSPGWPAREVALAAASTPSAPAPAAPVPASVPKAAPGRVWSASRELRVEFELNQPEGGRYARPYVAAWVEDADGFPVRTLSLWLLQGAKGLRWLPDLRRWSHSDQMRSLVDPRDLVATVSAATRPPGRYSVLWDGKDDHGQAVRQGRYTVFLEVSREHGTYQLLRHDFDAGGELFRTELKGNVEVRAASVELRTASRTPRDTGTAPKAGPTEGAR